MHQPLSPKALGLACGSTWAIGIAALAIMTMFTGHYGATLIGIISSVYLGYDDTIPGAIFGGLWGFADGFVCGYLLALFYNHFSAARP